MVAMHCMVGCVKPTDELNGLAGLKGLKPKSLVIADPSSQMLENANLALALQNGYKGAHDYIGTPSTPLGKVAGIEPPPFS